MKPFFLYRTLWGFLALLVLSGLFVTSGGSHAAALPDDTRAPTLTEVQPNTITGGIPTELVITGNGFVTGAVVILDGYGALTTVFVSANVLRATVSSDVPAAVYDLTVVNPDATSATLPGALTVLNHPGPTNTPLATGTPAPTTFVRPLLTVQSYGASSSEIVPGENLDFEMTLINSGQIAATNVIVSFEAGDFTPRTTGGVVAIGALNPSETNRFWQPLAASRSLAGNSIATLPVKVTYTDV